MPHSSPHSASVLGLAPYVCSVRVALPLLATLAVVSLNRPAAAITDELAPASSVADRPKPEPVDPPVDFFRIGALAGVGFPRPLSFELLTKIGGVMGLGLEYGLLPTVTVDGVSASAWAVSGDARWFPFRGAFFLGFRGGYESISATASVESVSEAANLGAWFINPRLGFLWTFGPGVTIAMEAGVQVPLTGSFSTTLPDSAALAVRDSTVVRTLSGALPTVDLLRVGFMF